MHTEEEGMSAFSCVCGSTAFTATEEGWKCTACGRVYSKEGVMLKPANTHISHASMEMPETTETRYVMRLREAVARILSKHSGEGWIPLSKLAEEVASEFPPVAFLNERARRNTVGRALSGLGLIKRRTRKGIEWFVG
jgi:hypothetical protein